MKRTVIGLGLLMIGTVLIIGLIISSVIYMPNIHHYCDTYPSKLSYLLLAGLSRGCFGQFFYLGMGMTLVGFIVLIREYLNK